VRVSCACGDSNDESVTNTTMSLLIDVVLVVAEGGAPVDPSSK